MLFLSTCQGSAAEVIFQFGHQIWSCALSSIPYTHRSTLEWGEEAVGRARSSSWSPSQPELSTVSGPPTHISIRKEILTYLSRWSHKISSLVICSLRYPCLRGCVGSCPTMVSDLPHTPRKPPVSRAVGIDTSRETRVLTGFDPLRAGSGYIALPVLVRIPIT